MDFEDRRVGLEERFSGLSEGQRYALALVLNLAFVGVVIAGFALLYTTGFNSRPGAPAVDPASELRAAVEDREATLLARADTEISFALPPESPLAAEDGLGEAPAESAPEAAAVEPAPEPSPPTEDAGTTTLAAVDAATAASAGDPASLWLEAGELLARLQADFQCSQISLQAGPEGKPLLRARVGPSDDMAQLRSQISDRLRDYSEISAGMGCRTVIGGGYVALSDRDGVVQVLDVASLSREVRAVLPNQGACAAIGQVISAQAAVEQRLAAAGRPAAWVRSGSDPALCERDDTGTWRLTAASSDRRAAVILPRDDAVATEVQLAAPPAAVLAAPPAATTSPPAQTVSAPPAETVVAAAPPPAAPSTTPRIPSSRPTPQVEPEAGVAVAALSATAPQPSAPAPTQPARSTRGSGAANGEARQVEPIDGPSPQLPAGVEPIPEGYSVTIEFNVDADGRPSELSLFEGGRGNSEVISAAYQLVNASRFPAAPRGGTYRGRHTVRFPSPPAALADLLANLDTAAAAAAPPAPEAEPQWDRGPTAEDLERYFPKRALQRGVGGQVQLRCTIGFDGRLACEIASEQPRSWGFGNAALEVAEILRAGPRLKDGRPSANEVVTLDIVFPEAE